MTRIALITYNEILPKYKDTSLPKIARAFTQFGCEVSYISLQDTVLLNTNSTLQIMHKSECVEPFDITIPFYRKTDRWANPVLKALTAKNGFSIDNPEIFMNKANMLQIFSEQGIPHPQSFVFHSKKSALEFWLKDKKEMILKSAIGGRGDFVFLISNEEECVESIGKIEENQQSFVFQEIIKPMKQDIRTLVVNGKIMGSYLRKASGDNFLSNVSKGGTVEAIEITDEEKKSALKAAKAYNLFLAGVDIMRKEDGSHVILEANARPGLKGFGILKQDIPTKIAQECLNHLESIAHA